MPTHVTWELIDRISTLAIACCFGASALAAMISAQNFALLDTTPRLSVVLTVYRRAFTLLSIALPVGLAAVIAQLVTLYREGVPLGRAVGMFAIVVLMVLLHLRCRFGAYRSALRAIRLQIAPLKAMRRFFIAIAFMSAIALVGLGLTSINLQPLNVITMHVA